MDQIPIHAVCNVYLNNHTLGPFAPGIALRVVSIKLIQTTKMIPWQGFQLKKRTTEK